MTNRRGEIVLAFGAEERTFRLGVGQWRAIQERCDVGPLELVRRLRAGDWRIDDIRETILQGLIGGGLDTTLAGAVTRATFDEGPPTLFVQIALQVALAALFVPADEPLGEKTPSKPRTRTSRSRAAKSASPGSTPPGN